MIAFLLGVVTALSAALIVSAGRGFPEAYAQQSANADVVALVGNGDQGKSKDNIYVIDTREKRLAVYTFNSGILSLDAVRNITWDMKFDEYGNQKPSVKELHDQMRK